MTEWKLQSYPEMLQALYQLKAATRIYRQERTAENAALMLEKFPAAAMAAAEDAAAWKRVMSGAAAGVLERAADGADVDKLAALGRNDRFYTLFAHEDAAAFQKFLAEREKNKADIAVLEGGGKADKKAKKPARGSSDAAKPAAKKEDAVVGELRREIEAAVTRDKKLTDTEKRNMLQALAETAEIKAAAKGAKCKLSFGGYAVDTVLAREGIVFEGKFSKYGGLSAETAKTLKNGKYVTTAGLAAKSTRAAENRAAKSRKKAMRSWRHCGRRKRLMTRRWFRLSEILQRADAAAVYDDVQNGGGILASVCREPDEAAAGFKRELARAAENSREVWGLFRGKGDDHCFDTSSFYEKCLQNTVAEQGISAAEQAAGLFRDYTKGKEGGTVLDMKRLVTKYAMATAGMSLPYEEAKQLLQREVYRMGMALRHSDRFDLEKFNFMNEVLAADGYKIGIQELPVKAKNGREAKPLGEEILKDMHKPNGVKSIKTGLSRCCTGWRNSAVPIREPIWAIRAHRRRRNGFTIRSCRCFTAGRRAKTAGFMTICTKNSGGRLCRTAATRKRQRTCLTILAARPAAGRRCSAGSAIWRRGIPSGMRACTIFLPAICRGGAGPGAPAERRAARGGDDFDASGRCGYAQG